MKVWKNILLAGMTLSMFNGCLFVVDSEDEYYIDAPSYVEIPDAVKELIADDVTGYSVPPESRYGTKLYPVYSTDRHNLPCYVRADFNGDAYDDYAYMFSKVKDYADGSYDLSTRVVIVVSTGIIDGYYVADDIDLGTYSSDVDEDLEEYWGIRLLTAGRHTFTQYYSNGDEVSKELNLANDCIYLASYDPLDREILSIDSYGDVQETVLNLGSIAKKVASKSIDRSKRVIKSGENKIVNGIVDVKVN